MQLALDTVYETRFGNSEFEGTPTFTVDAGEVNLYVSDSVTAPTTYSEMILDPGSPFGVGAWPVYGAVRYVLFKQATGTSDVQEFLLKKP